MWKTKKNESPCPDDLGGSNYQKLNEPQSADLARNLLVELQSLFGSERLEGGRGGGVLCLNETQRGVPTNTTDTTDTSD